MSSGVMMLSTNAAIFLVGVRLLRRVEASACRTANDRDDGADDRLLADVGANTLKQIPARIEGLLRDRVLGDRGQLAEGDHGRG